MKEFLRILRRFVPPYKKYLALNIVFNALSAVLNLFSFALVIPILNILFKTDSRVYSYVEWLWRPGSWEYWKTLPGVLKNNFLAYVSGLIETQGGSATLLLLGAFLIGMTLLKVAAMYFAFFTMIPIRTGVVRDIRNQINAKITRLPLSFFSDERKGDILARVSGDVNEVETSIMSSLDMLFKNPILIAVYLAGMFMLSWRLTLFALVLLPLAGYIMGRLGKTLKRKSLKGQEQWGYLMSLLEETLGGLRVIKAFNAEKQITDRFERHNDAFRRTTNRIYRRQQLSQPMSEFLGTVAIAIVLWYGGSLILTADSPLHAAAFIYYLVIFYSIINPAKELSRAAYAIRKGLASVNRIDKILCARNPIQDPPHPQTLRLTREIAFHDVWFKYRDEWVLKGIDLSIPKGTTLALVGASGAGKTTLVDLLPRFYDVTKGSITIDDIDIRHAALHNLRALIGYVNQEPILFNDSFFNNIAFGADNPTPEQVENAARIANAHDFIIASPNGYHTTIGDRGEQLSGGQRQRISIARAILKNPPILIFDEATSALDSQSEQLVQQALNKLMHNRTTLIIAHRLSTIRHAHQIAVLHHGQIVERGQHDQLLARRAHYHRLSSPQQ